MTQAKGFDLTTVLKNHSRIRPNLIMKKLILTTVVALAVSSYAMAQKDCEDFSQKKNSIEIGFNPFSNNFETFRIDELKYRHFFGNSAVRVRLGFGFTSKKATNNENGGTFDPIITPAPNTTNTTSNTSNSKEETVTTTKKSEFNIFAGYEYHFNISRHMNLYAGAEIGFEMAGGSEKIETTGSSSSNYTSTSSYQTGYPSYNTIENIYRTTTDRTYTSLQETKKKDAFGAFAFGVFTGIDVNIYKGLYLGAELGLQYKHKSFKAPEITNSGSSNSTTMRYNKSGNTSTTKYEYESRSWTTDSEGLRTTVTTTSGDDIETETRTEKAMSLNQTKTSESGFKLYAAPALRIGWRF